MIKLDVIMLAIWIAAGAVLNTLNAGLDTWQYWTIVACLVAVETRASIVAKKGLK